MCVRDADGSVEREPGHELGVDVVLLRPADLPDAGVGFAPPFRDFVGEAAQGAPRFGVEVVAGVREEPCGVDDPAVTVELVLGVGPVADPYRNAVGVAGPAGQFLFGTGMAAVE